MNQILSVEIEKKKKTKKASINSIVIVFCIFLIIFGIGTTCTGAYLYSKSLSNKSNENLPINNISKPIITIERQSSNRINIVVTHDKEIAYVLYGINDEDEVEINGNNKLEVVESINLNAGNNTIKISAKDINGISSEYETIIEVEEGPTISLTPIEGKIKAVTESPINIDKIEYYWDSDTENTKVLTINDTKNETLIDVTLEGIHTLNIKATDINGNETKRDQKVMGVNKPKVQVTTDGQSFFIKAEDSQGLSKVEITLNSNETITENIEGTEYKKKIPLENGENRLTVKVYNKDDISQISRVKFTK